MQSRNISSLAMTIGALALVLAGSAALASESASSSGAGCAPGSARAVVAGKKVCLRPGQRCNRRHEPVYRRHGFTCSAGRLARRKPPLPAGAAVEATIALGERLDPVWLAVGGDAVWVRGRNALIRVDTATNGVAARVPTPAIGFGYAAAGEGAVWQTSFDGSFLLRIDPVTDNVVATIPLGDDAAPEGVGITPGAVWVALHHQGVVARIDPATNEVVARISVGRAGNDGPLKLAAGGAGVWVDVPNANAVVHIDPQTNAVVGSIPRSGIPVVDGGFVYVVAVSQVMRIDPATNDVAGITPLGAIAADGAAGLGSVWVTTEMGLVRIDQATGKVVGKLGVRKGDIAVGAGSVWVAEYGTGRLLRIGPR